MTFAPLSNWRYDKSLYHNIQSGPQKTGSALNLTDTYILTSSGYVYASGQQQTYVALSTPGADYGTITPGPPQSFAADVGLTAEIYPETKTFEVTVVSDVFEGLRPVARQQRVYAPLGEFIRSGALHAVNIIAKTP